MLYTTLIEQDRNYVYDTGTGQWVRMTQSGSGGVNTDININSDSVGLAKQAQLPASLGQKAMAASLAVVLASDQSALAVTVASLPLPTGAATEATLAALNTKVTAVNTGAVVVSSSALPTGAATESTLSTLNGKVTACNTGAVVLASGTLTTITNVVHVDDNGGSLTIDGSVTANAGTNLNTSALALESGGNLATIAAKDFATQTTLAAIKAKTDNIDVALSTRTKPADTQTIAGAVTVSSGTITTVTNVVHVDDNSGSLTVDGTVTANPTFPATSGVTQVASSATNVTLQASNANRRGLVIYNDSTSVLYVKFGTTASTSSYTLQLGSQQAYELPYGGYTGRVDGIWATATGNAYVTEIT